MAASSTLGRKQSTSDKVKQPSPDSCQFLLSKNPTIHGHLRWRSHAFGKLQRLRIPISSLVPWFRRFVVIHDHIVFIFRDEFDSKPVSKLRLSSCRLIGKAAEIPASEMPWTFKLVIAAERSKDYYFSAVSEQDLNNWLEKLESCRVQAEEAFNRDSATHNEELRRQRLSTGSTSEHSTNSDTDEEPDYDTIDDEVVSRLATLNKVKKDIRNLNLMGGGVKNAVKQSNSKNAGTYFQPHPLLRLAPNLQTRQQLPALGGRFVPKPPSVSTGPAVAPRRPVQIVSSPPDVGVGCSVIREVPETPRRVQSQQSAVPARQPPPRFQQQPAQRNANVIPARLSDHDLEQFYTSAVVWNGDREKGATFLSERKVEGSYLIRDGTQPGSKVLVVVVNGEVKKFQIQEHLNDRNQTEYLLNTQNPFTSIPNLIVYYTENNLPSNNFSTKLTKAYGQLQA